MCVKMTVSPQQIFEFEKSLNLKQKTRIRRTKNFKKQFQIIKIKKRRFCFVLLLSKI